MTQKAKFLVFLLVGGLLLPLSLPSLAAQTGPTPIAEAGPYEVGVRAIDLTDASRADRSLETWVFYPALVSQDAPSPYPPDTSGAPYPLIIFSQGYGLSPIAWGYFYIEHLVSQGFVVVAPDHRDDPSGITGLALLNRPLDVLFVLNQLAELKDDDLVGMMDTEKVGITGVSFGGYTTIAAGGARIDPSYFTDWCSTYSNDAAEYFDSCALLSEWDDTLAYHAELAPPSSDDLWSATTDTRIQAILAISPCFGHLFGEQGLAAITIPTLVIGGTADVTCPYEIDAAYMYDHLGSAERYLVSLDGLNHFDVAQQSRVQSVLQQYATAFFGLYLQGKTDYAQYLTPVFADTFRDVSFQSQTETN